MLKPVNQPPIPPLCQPTIQSCPRSVAGLRSVNSQLIDLVPLDLPESCRLSADAIAAGISAAESSEARETYTTPSENLSPVSSRRPTSAASRVFPIPPGPTMVTMRQSWPGQEFTHRLQFQRDGRQTELGREVALTGSAKFAFGL